MGYIVVFLIVALVLTNVRKGHPQYQQVWAMLSVVGVWDVAAGVADLCGASHPVIIGGVVNVGFMAYGGAKYVWRKWRQA